MTEMIVLLFPVVGVVILVALVAFITRHYHKVPPNMVMVVYGRKQSRLVTSGGVFVWPIIENYKLLDLTVMTIKTIKDEVYTVSGVPIQLDWVAQVQIDSSEAALRTAAKAFLDKTRAEVQNVIEETLSANFRAIVGQMTVESIHRDRDSFVQKVQELASDDMAAMGVKVITMGIEEITDNQGYLEAMAAPQIAAIKRDARIARAEAERAARVKAAEALREAEQAEIDAKRAVLQQREDFELREVEVRRKVGMAQADSDREVQQQRALAVEQQQEAEVLVPARAEKEATVIRSEGERRRVEIDAEAQAEAVRRQAQAAAEATEKKGRAEAAALQSMKEAEARGRMAHAESVRAKLLALAEGRRELAAATAAEDEINLRQFVIEQVTRADIAKVQAVARAMAGIGGNVRVVDFGGGNGGSGPTGSTFMDMLLQVPQVAEMFSAQVEALSGEDFEQTVNRIATMLGTLRNPEAAAQLMAGGNESNGADAANSPELEALRELAEEVNDTPEETENLPQ